MSISNSAIRKYLNSPNDVGTFFKEYNLTTDNILKVDVTSAIETTTKSDEGSDYVFLLSKTEAENTGYLTGTWWLHTSASTKLDIHTAYYVVAGGSIDNTYTVNSKYGVRPAFWYSLK